MRKKHSPAMAPVNSMQRLFQNMRIQKADGHLMTEAEFLLMQHHLQPLFLTWLRVPTHLGGR